eukprot:3032456-Rhodomonas_salina.2
MTCGFDHCSRAASRRRARVAPPPSLEQRRRWVMTQQAAPYESDDGNVTSGAVQTAIHAAVQA